MAQSAVLQGLVEWYETLRAHRSEESGGVPGAPHQDDSLTGS